MINKLEYKERKRKYNKKYRELHKEELKEYADGRKEEQKIYLKNWYLSHKKEKQIYDKKYRSDNYQKITDKKRMSILSSKQKWLNWLSLRVNLKCSVCDFNKDSVALDFHHINGSKEFNISSLTNRAFLEKYRERVEKELKNPVILCANCHRILHYGSK